MPIKLIYNIGRLLTCSGGGLPRRKAGMSDTGEIRDAFIVADSDSGKILEIGSGTPAHASSVSERLDAERRTAVPGFVDCHTHPVYAGSRAAEFYMRAAGKSYLEIASSGGGISASLAPTRNAGVEKLTALGLGNAREFLFHGTTTFEAKSGYGLSLESELAMLEAIREMSRKTPQEVVPTFLGAHSIPPEFAGKRGDYLDLVCGDMLARVAAADLAEYADVFVEEGAFKLEEGERVVNAAIENGLGIRIHADEFTDKGAAALGAKCRAASVDHLGAISDSGIEALAASDTIAVLMPGTIFFIGSDGYAPARRLIDAGAPIALASDHNPGSSMIFGLPFVMTLAALKMKMSAEECLIASTINAAFSLNRAERKGSIEPGKDADILLLDVEDFSELPYKIGANVVGNVMIRGEWVKREHRLLGDFRG